MRRTNFVFYAPNKYFFLPPDEKKCVILASFVLFIDTKKHPWRYSIKPYCQGCINSLHGSTLIFHSGLLNPPFNAGIRQRLLRRKIGSGSALRLGSGFRLRLRIRNSQQIVSLSECGRGSYSLRQRFCYSCLFLPQKILFVNDLRQLNAYFYFCLHIRRKKAVNPP